MPYTTLKSSPQQIRRLILDPGEPTTPITCSTDIVSLDDTPVFEALSYVWGSPLDPSYITFNGHDNFPVTSNLFTALKYLRYPDKPRFLWVDALCINQQDIEERNAQVRLMGNIYESARPVLVWLGEGDGETDEAFDMLVHLQEKMEAADASDYGSKVNYSQLFSFYLELMQRPWFTRLWTVQELVLANSAPLSSPLVGVGWKWIPWKTLFEIWEVVSEREFSTMPGMLLPLDERRRNPTSKPVVDNAPEETTKNRPRAARPAGIKLDLLNNLRTSIAASGGDHLRSLLLNTHSSQATEPRDRIFALRGMLHPSDRDAITVDYARPIFAVYAEAVAQLFTKGQGPAFLAGVVLAGPAFAEGYASWVPRFGVESFLGGTRYFPPLWGEWNGVSGVGRDAVNGEVIDGLNVLRVMGMEVDVVKERIVFGKQLAECIARLGEVEELVEKARVLAEDNRETRPYLYGFKRKEPLWRVLVTNKMYSAGSFEVAPEEYAEMYRILRQRHEDGVLGVDTEDEATREYALSLSNRLPSSSFFITETGFFGIGPGTIENGDHLAIWMGAPAPFVLRPTRRSEQDDPQKKYFEAIGVAYVAGIMDGGMVDDVYCEDLEDVVEYLVR